MKIHNLKLTNYRNHSNMTIDFDEKLTLISGPNGSGKSNILEAIHMLSTGRSHRSRYDKDLIQYNKPFCIVNAKIETKDEKFDMELQIIRNEKFENVSIKKAKINKVVKSMQYFTGIFNSVLFSPEDIQLITGSPSERRKYMDDMISQVDIEYERALTNYIRAVKQRNKLLELINSGQGGYNQIDFYTKQILTNGIIIQEKREKMFKSIKPHISDNGKKLSEGDAKTEIIYKKNEISEERLEEHKNQEIAAMTTLIGPHRDDFDIYFNNHNVSEFGSRGEQRTCVLALKLSEIEYIEKIKKERPVLLLDDIFSELDAKHQAAVISTIEGQQTTITSTANPEFIQDKALRVILLPIER
ncbi:MAG: DNA replication/repair protein RecF [Patescibacteria group bacterium]